MLTLIFGIWASEPPPRAWRTTEKAGPDRVKTDRYLNNFQEHSFGILEQRNTKRH